MPLAAVADDGDLAVEEVEIAVAMNGCHRVELLFVDSDENLLRSLALGRARRPREADAARAHELLEPVRTDELLKRVDLFGRTCQLEDDRVGTDVGDAGLEDLAERHQLGPRALRRRHLDQRELALERLSGCELRHAEHVHELVHLLLDLLERMRLAVDAQRDPRDVVALGLADGEALDVEAAAGKHAGDARERARLVLEEDGQRVLHATGTSVSWYSTTSRAAAPAGIIGKQCSRGSTRASTTQVRPEATASASASSSSSGVSAVKPSAPYARASAA